MYVHTVTELDGPHAIPVAEMDMSNVQIAMVPGLTMLPEREYTKHVRVAVDMDRLSVPRAAV